MIKQAISSTKEENIQFREASAENLDFIQDGSVDMVVAGQAAHWFDRHEYKAEMPVDACYFNYADRVLSKFRRSR